MDKPIFHILDRKTGNGISTYSSPVRAYIEFSSRIRHEHPDARIDVYGPASLEEAHRGLHVDISREELWEIVRKEGRMPENGVYPFNSRP